MAKKTAVTRKRPRKTGPAARHEVNRAELDPLKARVDQLEADVRELRDAVRVLKGE